MKPYLVMMCDYGLDDACATAKILENAEKFSKIDILAVGGNFSPEISIRNLRTLLAVMPHDGRVTIVDTCDEKQNFEHIPHIHGGDGMGDVFEEAKDNTKEVKFAPWLESYAGCDILLSLGPMTLTEKILEKAKPGEFLFMAGNIAAEPNYNGYEFNEGLNPGSFSRCVLTPHRAVTLDTGIPAIDENRVNHDMNTVYGRLCERCCELSRGRGEENCYIWDDIAVRYLLNPEKFTHEIRTDKNGNKVDVLEYRGD